MSVDIFQLKLQANRHAPENFPGGKFSNGIAETVVWIYFSLCRKRTATLLKIYRKVEFTLRYYILFLVLLLFSGCSQGMRDMEEEGIFVLQKYVGYYLKVGTRNFWVAEEEDATFAAGEPVLMYVPDWETDSTVDFRAFENGDKIEVEILTIADSQPRQMPVYGITLVEKGTIDNIDPATIEYLATWGYEMDGEP